jgi:inner membrane protein
MASFFSHPAIPVALKIASSRPVSRSLFILCIFLTCFPDIDVIAFRFGIPYESQWGHRGFTHSFLFSFLVGVFCQFFYLMLGESRPRVFIWTTLAVLSHSLMDALTNGGLGVAWLWPFHNERFFFPWRPVEVSPIGAVGFISVRGLVVILSEIVWLWIPTLLVAKGYSFFVRTKKARA